MQASGITHKPFSFQNLENFKRVKHSFYSRKRVLFVNLLISDTEKIKEIRCFLECYTNPQAIAVYHFKLFNMNGVCWKLLSKLSYLNIYKCSQINAHQELKEEIDDELEIDATCMQGSDLFFLAFLRKCCYKYSLKGELCEIYQKQNIHKPLVITLKASKSIKMDDWNSIKQPIFVQSKVIKNWADQKLLSFWISFSSLRYCWKTLCQ